MPYLSQIDLWVKWRSLVHQQIGAPHAHFARENVNFDFAAGHALSGVVIPTKEGSDHHHICIDLSFYVIYNLSLYAIYTYIHM